MVRKSFSMSSALFTRELQNLSALPSNLNLIRYFHSWLDEHGSGGLQEPDRLYIVTDFIHGKSLASFIGTLHTSNHFESTWLLWAQGLYNALEAMHAIPMFHCDLHGWNVMVQLEPNGQPTRDDSAIKVLDVGLSKIYGTNAPAQAFTAHLGGHISYFSRARREDVPTDGYDDIWSAACVLSELCAGGRIDSRRGPNGRGLEFGRQGMDFMMERKDEARRQYVLSCGEPNSARVELLQAVLLHPNGHPGGAVDAASMKALASRLRKRQTSGSGDLAAAGSGTGIAGAGVFGGATPQWLLAAAGSGTDNGAGAGIGGVTPQWLQDAANDCTTGAAPGAGAGGTAAGVEGLAAGGKRRAAGAATMGQLCAGLTRILGRWRRKGGGSAGGGRAVGLQEVMMTEIALQATLGLEPTTPTTPQRMVLPQPVAGYGPTLCCTPTNLTLQTLNPVRDDFRQRVLAKVTFSSFFVPLVHAALGTLGVADLAQWRQVITQICDDSLFQMTHAAHTAVVVQSSRNSDPDFAPNISFDGLLRAVRTVLTLLCPNCHGAVDASGEIQPADERARIHGWLAVRRDGYIDEKWQRAILVPLDPEFPDLYGIYLRAVDPSLLGEWLFYRGYVGGATPLAV